MDPLRNNLRKCAPRRATEFTYVLWIGYQVRVLDRYLSAIKIQELEKGLYTPRVLEFSTTLSLFLSFSLFLGFMQNFSPPPRIYARPGRSL